MISFGYHTLQIGKWRFINCLEVGIWEGLLLLDDGPQQRWNVINVAAIVKVASIEISLADHLKNAK